MRDLWCPLARWCAPHDSAIPPPRVSRRFSKLCSPMGSNLDRRLENVDNLALLVDRGGQIA